MMKEDSVGRKHRILFLISRENILEPGVLKSQVFDLLGRVLKEDKNTEILVLNLPSLHSFLKNLSKRRAFKSYTKKMGIRIVSVPILPIGRSAMPVWAVPFFLAQAAPVVLFFALKYRINIIHARSYLSSLAVYFLKKMGLKAKVVFDMRAPYLLEGVVYRRWVDPDPNYRFWEKAERKMFSSADAVVSQATGMVDYVKRISPSARVFYIPNCVDTDKYLIGHEEREAGRKRLGIGDRFALVYSGSFGGLHPPSFIARLYFEFRKHLPDPYFLVVTHSNPVSISGKLAGLGISQSEFKVLHHPPNLEKVISLGDVGVGAMGGEIPTTPLVLSVKVAEYLAAGLPVISSEEMRSVAELVEKEKCGVAIKLFDQKDIRVKMQKLVREHEEMRKNALRVARKYFSVKVCAKKYLKIYDEIVSKSKS
ncbi:MAG: glycosyltransferase [Parcubacteria group bacterium]